MRTITSKAEDVTAKISAAKRELEEKLSGSFYDNSAPFGRYLADYILVYATAHSLTYEEMKLYIEHLMECITDLLVKPNEMENEDERKNQLDV